MFLGVLLKLKGEIRMGWKPNIKALVDGGNALTSVLMTTLGMIGSIGTIIVNETRNGSFNWDLVLLWACICGVHLVVTASRKYLYNNSGFRARVNDLADKSEEELRKIIKKAGGY